MCQNMSIVKWPCYSDSRYWQVQRSRVDWCVCTPVTVCVCVREREGERVCASD